MNRSTETHLQCCCQTSPPEVGSGGERDLVHLSIKQGFICFNDTLWFLNLIKSTHPYKISLSKV